MTHNVHYTLCGCLHLNFPGTAALFIKPAEIPGGGSCSVEQIYFKEKKVSLHANFFNS